MDYSTQDIESAMRLGVVIGRTIGSIEYAAQMMFREHYTMLGDAMLVARNSPPKYLIDAMTYTRDIQMKGLKLYLDSAETQYREASAPFESWPLVSEATQHIERKLELARKLFSVSYDEFGDALNEYRALTPLATFPDC